MARHIKVKAVIQQQNPAKFDLWILEQTNSTHDFGNVQLEAPDYDGFVYNGVCLASVTTDLKVLSEHQYYGNWADRVSGVKIWVYLYQNKNTLTDDVKSRENVAKDIPVEYWEPIKEAIAAYNEYYKED